MTEADVPRDPFVAAFGPPDEPAPPLHFSHRFLEEDWQWRLPRMGSGWFLGRFFFLFGEGLERFVPCLEAWSFLLSPADVPRKVVGYNAYGALLVMEHEPEKGLVAPVRVLDPLNVVLWGDSECVYTTLLTRWLPDRQLPYFFETRVYLEWLKTSGRLLGDDEILGIRRSLPLGGQLELDNFTPMPIVDYYRATGPTYAKAYARRDAED